MPETQTMTCERAGVNNRRRCSQRSGGECADKRRVVPGKRRVVPGKRRVVPGKRRCAVDRRYYEKRVAQEGRTNGGGAAAGLHVVVLGGIAVDPVEQVEEAVKTQQHHIVRRQVLSTA